MHPDTQVRETLAQLTDEQQATLLSGSGFWHTAAAGPLPSITISDGPHGLRKQAGKEDNLGLNNSLPATCFPTASALACSFDEELAQRIGQALGEECREQGVSVLLGPGINIKRSPLCGRAFEYFSEDPLLSGRMGAAMVGGIQQQGVGACPKHLAANSQEKARLTSDSILDARALHEIYLRPFEIVVKTARPWCIMAAYNRLNGTYCCENASLLEQTLRRSWGFKGAVVSDWGGMSDGGASLAAGLDLCMPGPRPDLARAALSQLSANGNGRRSFERATTNVAALVVRAQKEAEAPYTCDMEAHLTLARQAAEESAVLLKNDGVLPVSDKSSLAIIGTLAKKPRYQGAGSSKINPIRLTDPWHALVDAQLDVAFAPGYRTDGAHVDERLLDEAAALARTRDIAVVFAGLPSSFESEGFDRAHMAIPRGHQALIERVCAANPRTIVVLMGGAPVETPWRNLPAAVLALHLGGCQCGPALVNLLTGRANPSGKLAETWPERLTDTAPATSFPAHGKEIPYLESIYVGYRFFDSAHIEPAWPFGFGLSYTHFALEEVSVEVHGDTVQVGCLVRNRGSFDGAEVVQAYVRPRCPQRFAAFQSLAGWRKVHIAAGALSRISFDLDERAFLYWDEASGDWAALADSFDIAVGTSSRDIAATVRVHLPQGAYRPASTTEEPQRYRAPWRGCFDASSPEAGGASQDFAAIYGRPLPAPQPQRPFTDNSCFGEMAETRTGRFLLHLFTIPIGRHINLLDANLSHLITTMMDDMPIRALTMGGADPDLVEGIVSVLNLHYLRGARLILSALRKARL